MILHSPIKGKGVIHPQENYKKLTQSEILVSAWLLEGKVWQTICLEGIFLPAPGQETVEVC